MKHGKLILVAVIVIVLILGTVVTWAVLSNFIEDESNTYDVSGTYHGYNCTGNVETEDISEIKSEIILRFNFTIEYEGTIDKFSSILALFDSETPDETYYKYEGQITDESNQYEGWSDESDGKKFTYCFDKDKTIGLILITADGISLVARIV